MEGFEKSGGGGGGERGEIKGGGGGGFQKRDEKGRKREIDFFYKKVKSEIDSLITKRKKIYI